MGGADKLKELLSSKKEDVEKQEPEKVNPNVEPNGGRIQWSSPIEFLLTCIGYSVGLGNVWRFPYLCYKSGGGAFLIPYVIMMFLIGMPLLFMEYGFGQYFGVGSLSIFKKVCPLMQGIGIGYTVLNGLVCIYYNVIIAMSLYYLFASFTADLPWGSCGHWWNTELCGEEPLNMSLVNGSSGLLGNLSAGNFSLHNITRTSPSDEYFKFALLDMHPEHSISNLGEIRWHLCLCLLLAWILVIIFVSRGIQSTGKVAYFTATFPYLMLTVLVVRGVTLPGATTGLKYFFMPDWAQLKNPEIWFGAASQLFYSTNLAWGGMITMASYNSFDHNCYRDAIVINIVSFCTSIYAGLAVFSIIGYMADEYGLDVREVIDSGPGLAFVVYPRALSLMPVAPLFSVLFFFMLFLLGIGSQMVLIETVVTGFVDEFPFLGKNSCIRLMTTIGVCTLFFFGGLAATTQMVQVETILTGVKDTWPWLRSNAKWRTGAILAVCCACFFLGLPCTTQGGMYVLQLMDWYAASFCVLIIAIVECVTINWIYGNERFAANMKEMLGKLPGRWWTICWKYISPLLISAVLIFSLVQYKPAQYGSHYYPVWADGIGWCMTLASVVPIPLLAAYKFYRADGAGFLQRWRNATRAQVQIEVAPPPGSEAELEVKERLHHPSGTSLKSGNGVPGAPVTVTATVNDPAAETLLAKEAEANSHV